MSHPQFDSEPHIETTSRERLVYMANQISRFFVSQRHDLAVEGVRDHIAKFWDPRMRQAIRDHAAQGGEGLTALALEAVAGLSH
jgi:formate dehydrogenase subunit delta